jgi:hypothetical protein
MDQMQNCLTVPFGENMFFVRLLALTALLFLSACETIHYEYTPPATENGRQCAVQCASVREMCRSNENQLAAYKQQSCEQRSDSAYYVCMSTTTHNKKLQEKCHEKRDYCSEYANTSHCDDEYNQCFSTCGGTVQKIIEK